MTTRRDAAADYSSRQGHGHRTELERSNFVINHRRAGTRLPELPALSFAERRHGLVIDYQHVPQTPLTKKIVQSGRPKMPQTGRREFLYLDIGR